MAWTVIRVLKEFVFWLSCPGVHDNLRSVVDLEPGAGHIIGQQ